MKRPDGGIIFITRRRDRLIMQVMLTVLGLAWIFPLYSAMTQAVQVGGLGNFVSLFTDPLGGVPIWRTYLNSLTIGVIQAAVVVIVATTAGYAFGKLRFPGRDLLYLASILFLAIPGTALLVPMYYITNEMHLFNNYFGIGLPEAALTIPFGVLLMRNYAANIPDELIEAALMDQAGHLQIFWRVFVPLARPAITNLTVLCLMWSLQDFLWPSIFITSPGMTTAAQAVETFQNSLSASPLDVSRYSAGLVMLAIPAILLVAFGMRFITSGLTSGAVKE